MADVTLSKAVRSNLLSLQSTAANMAKTQERLATGLKVNSALDNPTNFFTASSLNSRASDLGRLLDSVSNAKSTIEAADKGLSSITKLVESAQATARQALQTAATVDTTTGATAGTLAGGAFTTVDVSGTSSAATAGTLDGATFSAVTVGAGSAATAGTNSFAYAADGTAFGASDTITFDVDVDGAGAQTITIDQSIVNGVGNNDSVIDTIDELTSAINAALTAAGGAAAGATATNDGTNVTITSGSTGTSSSVAITNATADADSGGNANTLYGIADGAGTAGQAAVTADSITFSLTVDGGGAQSITIDTAAVSAVGNNDNTIDDVDELVSILNAQISGATASNASGAIRIASDTTGASSSVAISSFSESVTSGATGLADGTDTGAAATTADSISFSLSIDGGTASTVTIDAAAVTAYNSANSTSLSASALTAANVVSLINDQAGATVAAVNGTSGGIDFTSTTTGTSSNVTIASISENTTSGSTGLANGNNSGAASSTTSSANPKRDEFVAQYNELLSQIDDLAGDASFNGVNLLDGDNLSVLFNEDGSSALNISGVTFNSSGLNLSTVATGGFNSDTAINTTLNSLSSAIDDLRTQASNFGSNLSVVEIRQDFTKELINTLETGAANLTLADSNEEAANLLALQTRQQLSSTALSLASQADQNVLRLF